MLQHADIQGNIYGITYEAVESVWEQGMLCVMDLELEVFTP
jgi:guanylate kinase